MISSYSIGIWLTKKQNEYMSQSDFLKTMVANTIFCILYKFNLSDKKESELVSIIEDCVIKIEKKSEIDNILDAQEMRDIIQNVLLEHFKAKKGGLKWD